MSCDVTVEACAKLGPRGLRCQLPAGHSGRHHADVDGPAEPCDVCEATAGEDCADAAACARTRERACDDALLALALTLALSLSVEVR
ncbi:hypothetical protein WME90_01780 [Sorangium sp. So ce375]|uniref:hypothetical protein n=1 Tax=Sorangium sp. So ce375 TaxID=3133306 RepID=UPI003F5C2597